MKISKKSYAKINIFLKILGEKDGFHQLESALAFIDLHDEISVKKSTKFFLKIRGEFAEKINIEENLFTKILEYFVKNFGISKNLEINLTKNIPVGAGLGGGSSNAAEFMKILNEIFSLKLTKEKLQKISFNFGSDIAFFFESKASIIKGRGHIVANIKYFLPIEILLINPNIFLSTKKVFENFNGNFSQEIATEKLAQENIFNLMKDLPNQLEKPAISIVPEIADILKEAKNQGTKITKMSGSGATCFAIFDEEKIDEVQKNITKKFPNFFIKKAKILANV